MADRSVRSVELARLLASGADRAEQLIALLGTEAAALESRDSRVLQETASDKQALIAELEALGSTLTDALRAIGVGGAADLDRWLETAAADPLAGPLRRLVAALAECHHANARNGAVIRQLSRHNRHLLSLVRGEEPGASVYGNDGRARLGPVSRYAARA